MEGFCVGSHVYLRLSVPSFNLSFYTSYWLFLTLQIINIHKHRKSTVQPGLTHKYGKLNPRYLAQKRHMSKITSQGFREIFIEIRESDFKFEFSVLKMSYIQTLVNVVFHQSILLFTIKIDKMKLRNNFFSTSFPKKFFS